MIHEAGIRFVSFCVVLAAMAAWQYVLPRKRSVDFIFRRWMNNLGLAAAGTLILRIVLPVLPVSLAAIAGEKGWGIFHHLPLPASIQWIAAVVILDLIIYLQHFMFHKTPVLWRLHQVHHTDLDIDVTTGIRFHPVEIFISMVIKIGAVAAFGFPAGAVLLFEVLLNATSLFNHANIRLPLPADRVIRSFIVTPDMHRVHHSVVIKEFNSNFGFNLSWWDRIFKTYRAQPSVGHDKMAIGLAGFRQPVSFLRLLMLPFIRK
jgi:sterol desaturase/sphingolipid hydroxylase (fatty acid hydroxylase superfamily)